MKSHRRKAALKPVQTPVSKKDEQAPSFQDQQLAASGRLLWQRLGAENNKLGGLTLRSLEELLTLSEINAPEGERARRTLSDILIFAVSRMSQLARRNPKHWIPITEQSIVWPVIGSLHPQWLKGIEPKAEVRILLEKNLKLGNKSIIAADILAKSKLTSPNTQAAYSLIELILATRSPLAREGLPLAITSAAWFKAWQLKACALKPYCKATSSEWATIALQAFKFLCPEPEKTSLAAEIGAHWAKGEEGEEGLRAESHTIGRLRSRIRSRVKQAICRLAPQDPN